MLIKTTIYHFIPTSMAKVNRIKITSVGEDMQRFEIQSTYIAG